MILDPSDLDPQSRYKLLIGAVVPRPIAWTSTLDRDGVRNLAPFSFFTVASRNPPMLCISVGPRVERPPDAKDTLSNVEETGEFVINIVSLPLSNTMYESSKSHPPEADEFEKAGLLFVVVKIQVNYRAPARFDDQLTLATRVVRQTHVRIDHAYELRRADKLLADATSTIACVDRNGQIQVIPDSIQA